MVLSNSTLQKLNYAELIGQLDESIKNLRVRLAEIDRATGRDELTKNHQSLKLIHKWFMNGGQI